MTRLIEAVRGNPTLRSGALMAAVPLGMSMVTAGLVEMDKLVANRRRTLERLEAAIRASQAHLDDLRRPRDVARTIQLGDVDLDVDAAAADTPE